MADTVDLTAELEQALQRVFRRVGKDMEQLLEGGLSRPQFFVLVLLKRVERLTVSDLAGRLGVTRSAITSLGDKLEEAGHIHRVRDTGDRRVVWLELTPAGRACLARMEARRSEVLRRLLQSLSPGEQEQLTGLLRKLSAACADA